jgi:hypothetical protein
MSNNVTDTTTGNARNETPIPLRGRQVTDAILNALNPPEHTNDEEDAHSAKRIKYIKLTTDQLSDIINTCSSHIFQAFTPTGRSPTSTTSSTITTPAYYNKLNMKRSVARPSSLFMTDLKRN